MDAVLSDILGPEGSCAAYVAIAVDVLLSHFEVSHEALVPFIASPELLALDQHRIVDDQMNGLDRFSLRDEPAGKFRLADLKAQPSRRMTLQSVLTAYLADTPANNVLRGRLGAAVAELDPYEAHSTWADPRLIGRNTANLLNMANWVEIEDGKLMYQSPPDEAAHLAQMEERHRTSVQSSETEARIRLAMEAGDYATAESARIAVNYANGDLPDDSDTDALKLRSTRLITTALLVARDGDDALLEKHEGWLRQVIALGLAEQSDRRGGSRDTVRYNRPAIATLALIHLWLRKGAKADRDALVALATRRDRAAEPAFAGALPKIVDSDPGLFKAAMRAAFSSALWRHSYDEDGSVRQSFEAERDAAAQAAVAAEIAWLDGGEEPAWPEFPKERPILRNRLRIRVPGSAKVEEFEAGTAEEAESVETSNLRVDSQAAAQWLGMLSSAAKGRVDWGREIVEAYSGWTAKMNGLGMPVEAEIDRAPDAWNLHYYALFAAALMYAPVARFEADIKLVTGLPDEPFGDVAQTVIHAADALYFNDPQRGATRPVELRTRMAERVIALRRWRYADDPASLRIDHDTGGVTAKMLLNTYDQFNGTRSYLPPALSDRVDPLFAPMRPLLPGGPTTFVALCVMNLLMVTPRARHLDFLLEAAEAWFERAPTAPFWTAAGTGARIVEWFEAVRVDEPALLSPTHPARDRIDRLLGRLVSVGVAEAHELEKKVEAAADEG